VEWRGGKAFEEVLALRNVVDGFGGMRTLIEERKGNGLWNCSRCDSLESGFAGFMDSSWEFDSAHEMVARECADLMNLTEEL
jgi:hypothetical protein